MERWKLWLVVPILLSPGLIGAGAYNVINAGSGRWPMETVCRKHHPQRPRHSLAASGPTISRVSPATISYEIPHAASGMYPTVVSVTVYGNRFRRGAAVRWNGKALPTKFVSKTQLTTDVPFTVVSNVPLSGESVTFTGKAWITVANPAPHGSVSKAFALPLTANAID